MKIKIQLLLLLAALSAAAQTTMNYGAGFSLVANPLVQTNHTVAHLFPAPPDFTSVYVWTGDGYRMSTFFGGQWDDPLLELRDEDGYWVCAPEPFTNTFNGTTPTTFTNAIPAGYSIKSTRVSGTPSQIGIELPDFSVIYTYSTGYTSHTYLMGQWDIEPTLAVGQGFWIWNLGEPRIWEQ